jgi:hypothetical protein
VWGDGLEFVGVGNVCEEVGESFRFSVVVDRGVEVGGLL